MHHWLSRLTIVFVLVAFDVFTNSIHRVCIGLRLSFVECPAVRLSLALSVIEYVMYFVNLLWMQLNCAKAIFHVVATGHTCS